MSIVILEVVTDCCGLLYVSRLDLLEKTATFELALRVQNFRCTMPQGTCRHAQFPAVLNRTATAAVDVQILSLNSKCQWKDSTAKSGCALRCNSDLSETWRKISLNAVVSSHAAHFRIDSNTPPACSTHCVHSSVTASCSGRLFCSIFRRSNQRGRYWRLLRSEYTEDDA